MVKFIKFVSIGGAATLLQFLLLALFVERFGWMPALASASSYGCSAIFNYVANYYFTFDSAADHKRTLPKFVVTVVFGMTLSTILFTLFLQTLNNISFVTTNLSESSYLIAQLFATLITLIINFLIHKFWIYRS